MDSGELELRKAFEDTTTKNVKAILEHGNATRKLMKELEEKVTKLEAIIRSQSTVIDGLRTQLAAVQTALFSKGT